MPAAAVHAAFSAQLLANWDQADAVILEANAQMVPPEGPFIVIQYPVANGFKPSLGRRFFEEGAARIVLNIPVGTGLTTGLTWADEIADIFRETELTATIGTLRTWEPSSPLVNDANEEGNWFELAVIVPYRYQFDD